MIIKSYIELDEAQKKNLFEFIRNFNQAYPFETIEAMETDYSGELSNFGKSHYSLLEGNILLGSLGFIVSNAASENEILVSAIFFQKENAALFPILYNYGVRQVDTYSEKRTRPAIKLVISPSSDYLISQIISLGFTQEYTIVSMIYNEANTSFDLNLSARPLLEFEQLTNNNRESFQRVYNSAFTNALNSSVISDEELDEIMAEYSDDKHFAGICLKNGQPAAIYMLYIEENIGWVEAVGVDAAMQGQGVGKLLVAQCIDLLKAKGAVNIKLDVADINNAARKLYKSLGFEDIERHSIWFKI